MNRLFSHSFGKRILFSPQNVHVYIFFPLRHSKKQATMGNAESIYASTDSNSNILCSIKQKNWNAAVDLCRTNPHVMQSMLPIYYALQQGASLDVIKVFHETYSYAISSSFYLNKFPFHLPFNDENPPLEVIKYLHDTHPKGIEMTDNHGSLLNHIACFNGAPLEVVKYLFDQYPIGITRRNHYGRLPIHCACLGKASLEVIEYLYVEFPPGLDIADNYGDYPIDIAFHHNKSNDVIAYLSNPQAYEKCKTSSQ